MVNHEQSRVLHEALSAVGAQSIYVLIAGAGHEGPEFVAPAITATVAGFLAEKLGQDAASTSTAGLELQSSAEPACPRGEAALRRLSRLCPGTGAPGGSEGERHD